MLDQVIIYDSNGKTRIRAFSNSIIIFRLYSTSENCFTLCVVKKDKVKHNDWSYMDMIWGFIDGSGVCVSNVSDLYPMTSKQRIIRITTIILTNGIIGSLTFYSVIMIHNTEDPHFAKKAGLISMAIILLSIMSGGYVLYKLKGD